MRELTRRGERPRCLHRRINGCMRLEDMQALKPRRVMGEGAVVVHGFRDWQVVCATEIKVILAMARRDMHKACAGFGGNKITRQQRHIEFIAMPAQRMCGQRAGKLRTLDHALDAMRANPGILFKLRQQGQRYQQPIPDFQIRFFGQTFDMQKRVINLSAVGYRAIARHGPGRGGPDHHISAHQISRRRFQDAELRMQSRADMIVIFNLRFRQRGFLNRAPHHRAQPAIERPIHQKLADLPRNRGFRGEIHRRVPIRPIPRDTKADEFFALHLKPMFGIGAAFGAEIQNGHRILVAALVAVFFFNLPFNRQAVAIPAGDVIRVKPRHLRGTIDHILQNFIERMADMQIAIGIGRAVMQHETLAPFGLRAEPLP